MTDLRKITAPFGLLDAETQEALKQAASDGKPMEMFISGPRWTPVQPPAWFDTTVYRVRPEPLAKPSIDWSHVDEKYRYMATDETGDTYLHVTRPEVVSCYWASEDQVTEADTFASFRPGSCHWRDSYVERPHD